MSSMKGFLYMFAHLFGFQKDPESVSNSEDDDDWGDDDPRLTLIREQIEYYFSNMNLEKDAKFRDEIDKSGDRSVPFEFILECPRIKLLETTTDDICEAATNSEYLELALDENNQPKGVRSKVPFVSDPHRSERILKISGIGKTVPQDKRLEFFRSLFNAEDGIEVVSVHVVRKEIDGQIVNTDTSIVEFSTVEGAEAVIEQGIQYGNKLLEIQRQFKPKNKENSSQKSTPKGKRGKGRNSKPKTSE